MLSRRMLSRLALGAALLVTVGAAPAAAQGKSKEYKVSGDKALVVTREVMGKHGYEVVRVEDKGTYQVVHYRRGNNGKGKGKGPMETMIIRKVANRIVFEAAPSGLLVDIDVRLRL